MTYYSREAITLDRAISAMPALAAMPHASRSSRYEHIPTSEVLRALGREGFEIHGLTTAKVRKDERNGFQKHLVRLRKAQFADAAEAPEVILINSHDGSCAYQLKAGMFRFACANGLIVGEQWRSVSVPHKGRNTINEVIEGTYEVVNEFQALQDSVQRMKAIELKPQEAIAFAEAAIPLRYDEPEKCPLKPVSLLRTYRSEDQRADLWTTFNKVQEQLVKGGGHGWVKDQHGRTKRASVRSVNGIDGQVKLNQALWSLAEKMAELKAA